MEGAHGRKGWKLAKPCLDYSCKCPCPDRCLSITSGCCAHAQVPGTGTMSQLGLTFPNYINYHKNECYVSFIGIQQALLHI